MLSMISMRKGMRRVSSETQIFMPPGHFLPPGASATSNPVEGTCWLPIGNER